MGGSAFTTIKDTDEYWEIPPVPDENLEDEVKDEFIRNQLDFELQRRVELENERAMFNRGELSILEAVAILDSCCLRRKKSKSLAEGEDPGAETSSSEDEECVDDIPDTFYDDRLKQRVVHALKQFENTEKFGEQLEKGEVSLEEGIEIVKKEL